jgi:hypothetical protein
VLLHDLRLTIAVVFVKPSMDTLTVLKRVLRLVQRAGVRLKCLFADNGIETGYRLIEQVRARTSSPNPALRFLLMGVALLIVNMWIRLHWLFLRLPGSGPRRVARWRFRLDRMSRFLTRAIERFYGVVTAVAPAPT